MALQLPPTLAFSPGLALALAIGALVGVERGWQLRDEPAGGRVAGIRTFAIMGLFGGLAGLLVRGPLAALGLVLVGGAVAALLLGYAFDMAREGNVSATSAFAAIMTLALGALAATDHKAHAAVGAGAMVMLLASREPLHRALASTNAADMKALLRLVLVVFVVLPLLPDVAMGPFGALNPRRLWLVVVVTAGISFTGYGLSRWLGTRRGALLTAGVGALVSSTAVTLDAARRVRDGSPGPSDEAAVAVASMIMFVRGLFLVAVLAPLALTAIATLILPALLVSAAAAAALLYRSRSAPADTPSGAVKAPGLGLALLFAATVAALSIATAWTQARFGGDSGAIVIALGGTADIDSAIAAVGALPPGSLSMHLIALAITAPILFNTLFKLAILLTVGGVRRTLFGAASLAAAALALFAAILLSAFG